MPPRLTHIATGGSRLWRPPPPKSYSISCSICCRTALIGCRPQGRKKVSSISRIRKQSNLAAQSSVDLVQYSSEPLADNPDLKSALIDLQKHHRSYVNLSKLHLALRGLEQQAGLETIRVAIIGPTNQKRVSSKVRELVRVLFADPLKEEEEWERTLMAEQEAGNPVLLRIGGGSHDASNPVINNRLVKELSISPPTMNAHRLEILVIGSNGIEDAVAGSDDLLDAILVPSVEIPTSNTGRYTLVTTPVHKALVVGDGILGAASVLNLPVQTYPEIIISAVNLPSYMKTREESLPFQVIDISLAREALKSFRESINNAMRYEHDWFKSGVPGLLHWVKAGTVDELAGSMKAPVRWLIQSVLADAARCITDEETRRNSALLSSHVPSSTLDSLRENLKGWAQNAHTELRDQLDVAFEGKRWRKLGWWKLFWRVDDVSMIASDILNQRFLTEAEKEVIYLAGKIEEAGVFKSKSPVDSSWAYKPILEQAQSRSLGSAPPPLRLKDIMDRPQDDAASIPVQQPWPLHIPVTRSYLSMDTVPALQALAQKLVLQTLTTSSMASVFAGLVFASTLSTTYFEAGAVAAFGIVWSLRRMQRRWERAREFWEQEVREEGRKSVRAVESVVNEVLSDPGREIADGSEELDRARNAVKQARDAFEAATHPKST